MPCRPGVVASSRRCRTTRLDGSETWLVASYYVGTWGLQARRLACFGPAVRCRLVEPNCKPLVVKQLYDNASTGCKIHFDGPAMDKSHFNFHSTRVPRAAEAITPGVISSLPKLTLPTRVCTHCDQPGCRGILHFNSRFRVSSL